MVLDSQSAPVNSYRVELQFFRLKAHQTLSLFYFKISYRLSDFDEKLTVKPVPFYSYVDQALKRVSTGSHRNNKKKKKEGGKKKNDKKEERKMTNVILTLSK